MDNDAFIAGIEPGGLRTRAEIKILICYVLNSIHFPIPDTLLTDAIQTNGLANYFETKNALADLLANQSILLTDGGGEQHCQITDKGRLLAESLSTTLPRSVREKAVNAVWTVLSQAKLQQENQVFFHETEHGILVECHISDGASDMMTITLRVPDTLQAGEIKKRFQRDPLIFYRTMTALLAGEKKMVSELLSGFAQQDEQPQTQHKNER